MGLDFHHTRNRERLLSLSDEQQAHLENVFGEFEKKTGLAIDPYKSMRLSHENCTLLLQILVVILQKDTKGLSTERGNTLKKFEAFLQEHQAKQTDFIVHGD